MPLKPALPLRVIRECRRLRGSGRTLRRRGCDDRIANMKCAATLCLPLNQTVQGLIREVCRGRVRPAHMQVDGCAAAFLLGHAAAWVTAGRAATVATLHLCPPSKLQLNTFWSASPYFCKLLHGSRQGESQRGEPDSLRLSASKLGSAASSCQN